MAAAGLAGAGSWGSAAHADTAQPVDLSSTPGAHALTLTPTADAYTLAKPPAAGTGAYPVLMAGDTSHDHRTALLAFTVPAIPSIARDVQARLVLDQTGVSRTGTAEVRTTTAGWQQLKAQAMTAVAAPGAVLASAAVAPTGSPTTLALAASSLPAGEVDLAVDLVGTSAASSVSFASSNNTTASIRPQLVISYTMPTPCSLSDKLVPTCGTLLGSTSNTMGTETTETQAITRQEAELGRTLDIVHVYKRDAQDWPTPEEVALVSDPTHPRTLLVNWKPEQGATWAQVAAGSSDALIDADAAKIKTRLGSTPFFLTIHHEPEDEVLGAGSGFTPADYSAMFRHVILRLRADGDTNIVSVWDMMGFSGWGSKGFYPLLYPGDDVVDWIGYDPYSRHGDSLTTFANLSAGSWPGFYTWATTSHPGKPLMLAEFGVSNALGTVSEDARAAVFASLAAQATSMPAIKAMVFFDHAFDASTSGSTYSWESSASVLAAAKASADDPYLNPRTGYLP